MGSCQPSWKAWRTVPFQWIILDAQWSKIERFSFKKLSLHSEQCSISLLLWEANTRPSCLKPGREGWQLGTLAVFNSWQETSPKQNHRAWLNRSLPAPSFKEHEKLGRLLRYKTAFEGCQGERRDSTPCAWDATARLLLAAQIASRASDKSLGAQLRERVCLASATAILPQTSCATLLTQNNGSRSR